MQKALIKQGGEQSAAKSVEEFISYTSRGLLRIQMFSKQAFRCSTEGSFLFLIVVKNSIDDFLIVVGDPFNWCLVLNSSFSGQSDSNLEIKGV